MECAGFVRGSLDLAVRYRLTFCFFWHPVYIAKYPACREAIDELVRLLAEMPVPPVLMGPDEVAIWWQARADARIAGARQTGGRVTLEAACDHDGGFVLKVPTGGTAAGSCAVDGEAARFECAHEFGQHWAFVPLPPGRHTLELSLEG